ARRFQDSDGLHCRHEHKWRWGITGSECELFLAGGLEHHSFYGGLRPPNRRAAGGFYSQAPQYPSFQIGISRGSSDSGVDRIAMSIIYSSDSQVTLLAPPVYPLADSLRLIYFPYPNGMST